MVSDGLKDKLNFYYCRSKAGKEVKAGSERQTKFLLL